MAMHSIDVPLGGPVLAIIMALGYTVLLWLSAEVVLQVCFTRPDEPICTDVPLGGGGFARALFDQETELLGVPSGSWCPIVPNRWSKTPAAISLYVLLGMLVVLGLGRFFVQDFGAWLIGIDPHTLVELEGPWHVTPLLLYVGSFLVLCPRIIRPAYRAKYTFALFLAAFILIYASDLPPLSRLFSLIISGIGTLVACYSTNYIEEDGRKHWYWFFLLLTFGALLNIVTTDNIGTLASQWEVMTWASFALVAWERTSKARDAAIKYVVLCCSAAYLMIVGFFMIGGNHTQYGEIVANLAVHSDDVLKFALVFTLLGFAAKAGLVPLHSWAARRPPRRAVVRVRAALRRAHQDGRVRRGDGLLRAHRLQGARLDRDLRRPHRPRPDGHVHGPVHDGLRRMDGPQAGRPQAYARLLHHGAGRRNLHRPRPRHVAGGGGRAVPCPEPRDHEGLALPLRGRPHFPRRQPQAFRSRWPRPRNAVGRGLHEHRHRFHHGPAAVQRLREQIPHDRGLHGRRTAAHRGGAHRGEPRGGDLLHAHPAHDSA